MSEINWDEIHEKLLAPWPYEEMKIKPGAVNKNNFTALALPHIDARLVSERLDEVVGVENWSDSYQFVPGANVAAICKLTVYGVTKEGLGEELRTDSTRKDAELYKAAESDALKRAAQKFGIGRYLHSLPKVWLKLDEKLQKFIEAYPRDKYPIKVPSTAKVSHIVLTETPPKSGTKVVASGNQLPQFIVPPAKLDVAAEPTARSLMMAIVAELDTQYPHEGKTKGIARVRAIMRQHHGDVYDENEINVMGIKDIKEVAVLQSVLKKLEGERI